MVLTVFWFSCSSSHCWSLVFDIFLLLVHYRVKEKQMMPHKCLSIIFVAWVTAWEQRRFWLFEHDTQECVLYICVAACLAKKRGRAMIQVLGIQCLTHMIWAWCVILHYGASIFDIFNWAMVPCFTYKLTNTIFAHQKEASNISFKKKAFFVYAGLANSTSNIS